MIQERLRQVENHLEELKRQSGVHHVSISDIEFLLDLVRIQDEFPELTLSLSRK
jgi:hypothetical protein